MAKPIHHQVQLSISPFEVYEIFMDEKRHGKLTGGAATISREVGGAFSQHDGQIVGRNLELIPGERIVQSWRFEQWEPGVYSVVKFDLSSSDNGTTVTMDHAGVLDEFEDGVAEGWQYRYWEPLKKMT